MLGVCPGELVWLDDIRPLSYQLLDVASYQVAFALLKCRSALFKWQDHQLFELLDVGDATDTLSDRLLEDSELHACRAYARLFFQILKQSLYVFLLLDKATVLAP